MAKFEMEMPTELLNEIERLSKDIKKIFGEMTKAGAQVVLKEVTANLPPAFRASEIMKCLKVTETYETPSDGAINTKVGFFGYFENKDGRVTPAPLVANVFEYGSSKFEKQPFFRKSFSKAKITKAMLKVQKTASGGVLDE